MKVGGRRRRKEEADGRNKKGQEKEGVALNGPHEPNGTRIDTA